MFAYVADPEAALRKMVSHLRPGEQLFIDMMHSSPLYTPIYRLRSWVGLKKRRLLFSCRQIQQLFDRVGLTDVKIVMREYPLFCALYADKEWSWPLSLRNSMARHYWLNVFGIVCFAFGSKRSTSVCTPVVDA
jgi:hypothetical protein